VPRPGAGLRQQHLERTRRALAAAALGLFAERGFAATTVDDIAARAGVSPRTFFRYFPSKEAVLYHDATELVHRVEALLAVRPASAPPLRNLLDVLADLGDELAGEPERVRLLCRLLVEEPKLVSSYRVWLLDVEERIVELIVAHHDLGAADVRLRAPAAALLSLVGAAFRCWVADGAAGPLRRYVTDAGEACRVAFSAEAAPAR